MIVDAQEQHRHKNDKWPKPGRIEGNAQDKAKQCQQQGKQRNNVADDSVWHLASFLAGGPIHFYCLISGAASVCLMMSVEGRA
jgi:hypothetical protein